MRNLFSHQSVLRKLIVTTATAGIALGAMCADAPSAVAIAIGGGQCVLQSATVSFAVGPLPRSEAFTIQGAGFCAGADPSGAVGTFPVDFFAVGSLLASSCEELSGLGSAFVDVGTYGNAAATVVVSGTISSLVMNFTGASPLLQGEAVLGGYGNLPACSNNVIKNGRAAYLGSMSYVFGPSIKSAFGQRRPLTSS